MNMWCAAPLKFQLPDITSRFAPLPLKPLAPQDHVPLHTEGMAKAARVFREDVGRDPTSAELQAGLLLADTQAALFNYLELEIQVGDRVMWAERDHKGEFLHRTRDGRDDALVFAYGTVTAQPEGWHADNTVNRDDGRTVIIGRKWLIKAPG